MTTLVTPTTNGKTRKLALPVHGSVRWIRRPVLPLGLGRLSITSLTEAGPVVQEYDMGTNLDHRNNVIGWTLARDDDELYDLPADLSSCSCPDRTFHPEREGGCKHMKALSAALRVL
jgi:hypothetical protein